jgi:predicted peroxiredoxin
MASLLVHITCGPENPTKAALAFFVAAAAVEAGHSTHVFLAGDAVQLMREAVRNTLTGLGTAPFESTTRRSSRAVVVFTSRAGLVLPEE